MQIVLGPNGPELMSRHFRVGFQNVHRSIENANVILEEAVKRDWDVVFIAEPWVEKKAGGWATTVQRGFDMVSTLARDTKLVGYINIRHRQEVEKTEESSSWYILKVAGQVLAGVYMSKDWSVKRYGEVAALFGEYWRKGRKALLVGDWNAHHQLWGCANSDGKGKEIKHQLESRGGRWLGIVGESTFRRISGDHVQESVLDIAWQGPQDSWQTVEHFWTGSDHKAISFQVSMEAIQPFERKIVDWLAVKAAVEDKD